MAFVAILKDWLSFVNLSKPHAFEQIVNGLFLYQLGLLFEVGIVLEKLVELFYLLSTSFARLCLQNPIDLFSQMRHICVVFFSSLFLFFLDLLKQLVSLVRQKTRLIALFS